MMQGFRLLVLAGFSVLVACSNRPHSERWIIPKGYVGWLRLDYGVAAQPPLPVEGRRYLVRIPPTGRIQTSTAGRWGRDIEFAVEEPDGRHPLEKPHKELSQRYGVQVQHSTAWGPHKQVRFACVFVGLGSDFRASKRNCDAWELGQPEPPKFKKYSIRRGMPGGITASRWATGLMPPG
jgi:hypothetical protein